MKPNPQVRAPQSGSARRDDQVTPAKKKPLKIKTNIKAGPPTGVFP
jgi:hypothetical protein